LSGIGTVLNGNVGRRNAVEKFHASLDYLRREKQIGQFVWLHVWHPSARFQWHHQHVWEFKKNKINFTEKIKIELRFILRPGTTHLRLTKAKECRLW
jgi:hypothetical protein